MWGRGVVIGAAAALVLSTTALAGSSSPPLRLGKINTGKAKTELRGSVAKPLLQLQNKKGVPLALLARPGVAPFAVNSKTKVVNLNADLLDGIDGAALQKRVSGTCASGQAIRIVNADGTVSCQAVAGSAGGTVTSVDSGTGLTGGPITTAGALSVAPSYRLPQSCSANQVPKSDGSGAWSCTDALFDSSGFWKLGGNAGTNPPTDFLGTTDAKALAFKTNGTERMRLDSSGNLGIGTASPSEKLEATGNIRASSQILESQGFEGTTFPPSGWTTGGNANWVRDTTTFFAGAASAASGTIGDSQSSYLDFDVTFPTAGLLRFHWKVDSEGSFDFLRFCFDNDACTYSAGYEQRISGTVDWTQVVLPVTAGAHSFRWVYEKDSSFSTGQDKGWLDDVSFEAAGNVFARNGIDTDGTLSVDETASFGSNVGIGTTSPTQLLHLNVTAGHGEGMEIDSAIAGHSPAIYLNHTGTGGRAFRIASFGDNTNAGSFRIRDESGGGDRFAIDSSGNVGVGTTSQTRKLDVNGVVGAFDGGTRSRNGGLATEVGATLIDFGMNDGSINRFGGTYTQANQGGLVRVDARSGVDLFQFLGRSAGTAGDANELVGITSAGNVGIGVASPSNILAVQQSSTTDPIADAWTTYSSRRWKTKIHSIRDALALVERLRGVRFHWKANGKHDLGLIAEEVEKVLPGLVSHDRNGRARGLDYARLVPVLIEAMKEQQAELVALRHREASLETRLAQVERWQVRHR